MTSERYFKAYNYETECSKLRNGVDAQRNVSRVGDITNEWYNFNIIIIIIIIIIKNECHSNIIVDRLQGCIYVHCESKNWTLFHLSITLANTVRF